tara:strand:- start:1834 stop:2130 length:297 start_codon:yes stop_codon:yes gene_type:complete
MNVKIGLSDRADKRFVAVFRDKDGNKVKTTHFGLKRPNIGTFIDHKDEELKTNYLKRHKPRENWEQFMTAGSLSRYILWNKPTFKKSFEDYKKRFKLK